MSPAEVWRRERIPGTPLLLPQPGFDGSSQSPPVPGLPWPEVTDLSLEQGWGKEQGLIWGAPCQGWDTPVGLVPSSSTRRGRPCTHSRTLCYFPHVLGGFFGARVPLAISHPANAVGPRCPPITAPVLSPCLAWVNPSPQADGVQPVPSLHPAQMPRFIPPWAGSASPF